MTNIRVTVSVEIDDGARGISSYAHTIPNVATGANPRYFSTDACNGMAGASAVIERAIMQEFGDPPALVPRRTLGA